MNSMYKELTDKALQCQQSGDLNTAEKICTTLLEIDPDDAYILNLMGLVMIARGKTNEAIDYLSKAFIISQTSASASNLAKAYYTAGMLDKAIKLFYDSLEIEKLDDTYYSLGLAYKKAGDINAAIAAYKNALEQNECNYSACFNLALAYIDKGDSTNALYFAEKCTLIRDDDEALYAVLSGLYEKFNNYEEAVNSLKKAIDLNPKNFLYYYNTAVLNSKINNNDEAVFYYLKAISLNHNHIESYVNLANLIKKQDSEKAIEYLVEAYKINPKEENLLLSLAQSYRDIYKNDESIKILKELIFINPLCAEAYSQMAMNYMDLCQYEKALKHYDLALKISHDNLNFQHGRAVALKYLGKISECREILEEIVQKKEASVEAKITLGMLYLQDKNFQKGMELYRLRLNNIKSVNINQNDIWEPGQSIENKVVLVYSNCGLGDSIMYSRYLPFLQKKSQNVILQTDNELIPIMQESFPFINVIGKSTKPPKYDTVLQFMDIQLALGMDFGNIPSAQGYLKANEKLIEMFSKLPEFKTDKKKIGLFWQGNRRIFKNRSVSFELIKKLTENKECEYYSFQLGAKIEETENFHDLSKHIKDYADTAALLKNIDLLITIDSSIVHMAGALGVKTHLLLPKTAEWRWFYDEKSTPWYESVTIFKQKESGNWSYFSEKIA